MRTFVQVKTFRWEESTADLLRHRTFHGLRAAVAAVRDQGSPGSRYRICDAATGLVLRYIPHGGR